ncbi:hypothetical protein SASPL_129674 [Salvia splendens]|uniref:Uncharacterized protein n=1 Tax=Salvia splendens TaxID=180675 RepID=A0A8X8XD61_SALSN|nr:hypothetical protein SASPL_129674 [Salvia splendens]
MIKTSKGPSLFPNGPTKGEFGEKLLSVTGSFHKAVTTSLKENRIDEAGAAFDEIDSALSNFDDGLFFLGLLSLGPYYCVAGADKSDWNESRMSHQLQHPEHERVMWFRSDQEGDFEPLPLPQGSHQCIRIRERAKADRKA